MRRLWLLVVILGVGIMAALSVRVGTLPANFVRLALSLSTVAVVAAVLASVVPLFNPSRLTLPAVWFFAYVGLIVVGGHIVLNGIAQPEPGQRFFVGVHVGLLCTAFGAWLAARLLGITPLAVDRWYRDANRPDLLGRYFSLLFGGLAIVAFALTVNYVREAPVIPLVEFLRDPGAYVLLSAAREESFKLLDSRFLYAYSLLRVVGWPFLIAVAAGMYRITKTRGWLAAFAVVTPIGLLFAGGSLAKFPVASTVLVLFTYFYLDNHGRINPRFLLAAVVFFLAFPVAVVFGLSLNTGLNLFGALETVGFRIFYDPALTAYHYFEIVPFHVDYLGGRTIADLSRLMGWTAFDIENYVAVVRQGSRLASGSSNAAYIANLYADWGFSGIALGGFLAGLLLSGGQALLLRLPRTPVTLAATAHLMFCTLLLTMTSLPTVLMTNGALTAVALPLVISQGHVLLEGIYTSRHRAPEAASPS